MKTQNKDKRLVRIYKFADVHKGWGDGGTIGYIRLDEVDIDKEICDGGTYTWETLTDEAIEEISDKLGVSKTYRDWNWETATEEDIEKERKRAERILESLEVK